MDFLVIRAFQIFIVLTLTQPFFLRLPEMCNYAILVGSWKRSNRYDVQGMNVAERQEGYAYTQEGDSIVTFQTQTKEDQNNLMEKQRHFNMQVEVSGSGTEKDYQGFLKHGQYQNCLSFFMKGRTESRGVRVVRLSSTVPRNWTVLF